MAINLTFNVTTDDAGELREQLSNFLVAAIDELSFLTGIGGATVAHDIFEDVAQSFDHAGDEVFTTDDIVGVQF
jgi:hypothetical protein